MVVVLLKLGHGRGRGLFVVVVVSAVVAVVCHSQPDGGCYNSRRHLWCWWCLDWRQRLLSFLSPSLFIYSLVSGPKWTGL